MMGNAVCDCRLISKRPKIRIPSFQCRGKRLGNGTRCGYLSRKFYSNCDQGSHVPADLGSAEICFIEDLNFSQIPMCQGLFSKRLFRTIESCVISTKPLSPHWRAAGELGACLSRYKDMHPEQSSGERCCPRTEAAAPTLQMHWSLLLQNRTVRLRTVAAVCW